MPEFHRSKDLRKGEKVPTLQQNLLAEFVGSMFLVIAAIGSTILAFNVLGADLALAVFMNAIAVAFVLFALIESFGSISGSHFNPAVTLAIYITGQMKRRRAIYYVVVQFLGGFTGLLATHLMFYDTVPTLITISDNMKSYGMYFAEFLGAFILIGVIIGCVRGGSKHTGLSVAYIVGGMLVTTASTMYANPMITFCRIFTYAICGIAPLDALYFIIAEIAGAVAAALVFGIIYPMKLKDKCDPFECPPNKLIEIKTE
jgi:glycerol uptake facilitator-like aquaporin